MSWLSRRGKASGPASDGTRPRPPAPGREPPEPVPGPPAAPARPWRASSAWTRARGSG